MNTVHPPASLESGTQPPPRLLSPPPEPRAGCEPVTGPRRMSRLTSADKCARTGHAHPGRHQRSTPPADFAAWPWRTRSPQDPSRPRRSPCVWSQGCPGPAPARAGGPGHHPRRQRCHRRPDAAPSLSLVRPKPERHKQKRGKSQLGALSEQSPNVFSCIYFRGASHPRSAQIFRRRHGLPSSAISASTPAALAGSSTWPASAASTSWVESPPTAAASPALKFARRRTA